MEPTLLKRADDLNCRLARDNWKPLASGDNVRVSWMDHPDNMLLIEELPGKPLKRRVRRKTYRTDSPVHHIFGSSAFLMANLLRDAKFSSGMKYDAAVKTMDKALEKAKAHVIKTTSHDENFFKQMWPRGWGSEDETYYLNVEPADYEPIRIKGKGFGGKSEWTSFRFYDEADKDDDMAQLEGMSAFYKSKSAGGARKLFKMLKADPDLLKSMSSDKFTAFLAKNKIGYSYVPTVWR